MLKASEPSQLKVPFRCIPIGERFRLEFHGLPSLEIYIKVDDRTGHASNGRIFDFTDTTGRNCLLFPSPANVAFSHKGKN